MAKIKVFLDTDVIIASLLSNTGASFEVVNSLKIEKFISNIIEGEIAEVCKRHKVSNQKRKSVINKIKTVNLSLTKDNLLKYYRGFVTDEQDVHVVLGATQSKASFLLTHNLKHFQAEKINSKLRILVLTPGNFPQYLRSKNKF